MIALFSRKGVRAFSRSWGFISVHRPSLLQGDIFFAQVPRNMGSHITNSGILAAEISSLEILDKQKVLKQ
jgi:hypothetical protein